MDGALADASGHSPSPLPGEGPGRGEAAVPGPWAPGDLLPTCSMRVWTLPQNLPDCRGPSWENSTLWAGTRAKATRFSFTISQIITSGRLTWGCRGRGTSGP